jgi:23S rRNA pseudouridine2605 synthase
VGRLDKDSSGILLMTNDGQLANIYMHPSYQKTKVYEIKLGKSLLPLHHQMIANHGVELEDGNSRLGLERMVEGDDHQWRVTMHEGRNRQIRRTFESLGYAVVRLKRTQFGQYSLDQLRPAQYVIV